MKKFWVVSSERSTAGRGANGRTLYQFLKTYVGAAGVGTCTPDELLRSSGIKAEYVFAGLPSSFGAKHLAKLRFKHLIPFDLTDDHSLKWDEANRELLKNTTDLYFKAWTDQRWNFGMRMGVLPVRRYGRLRLAIEVQKLAAVFRQKISERTYDVMFLGAATGPLQRAGSPAEVYNQRIEWLLELKRQGAHLNLWGGLVDRKVRPKLLEKYGDLSPIAMGGSRTPFWKYFKALQQSRVALTPEGYAPWSYRHYEAIYAGATLVTCDFRHLNMLIPLPTQNMIHVEAGQPVIPAIEKALALRKQRPELAAENIQHLERYLYRGMYSRRRPELFARFMAQFSTAPATPP